MFPFMAGIFISLCLQSPHRWKVSKRGGHRFTSGETSSVYSYLAFQICLTGAHHPGCSRDSLGIILARSGCCACLVAGAQMSLWLSIFSLPRAQIRCEGESCSHLTWLSLLAAGCCARGTGEGVAAWAGSAGDPRGCAHATGWEATAPERGAMSPECSLLASRKRGSSYRETQHVGSRFPPCITDVQVYDAVCSNKPMEKSIPSIWRALGQIKQSHDLSWKRNVSAVSLLQWLGLGTLGERP